jgi:Protein of unknown function (DUF4238)
MPRLDPLRRRNHFVSATYLAPFTDTGEVDGLLYEYRRSSTDKVLPTRPTAVATERDLYVRSSSTGEKEDSIERFFSASIEAPFASVRKKMLDAFGYGLLQPAGVLSRDERLVLANYLTTQQLRTPLERDAIEWLGKLGACDLIRTELSPGSEGEAFWENALGRRLSPEDRVVLTKGLRNITSAEMRGKKHWLGASLRNAMRLGALVEERFMFSLVPVPSHVELVTCDMPLITMSRSGGVDSSRLGAAWLEPDFEAILPLSRRCFLHVTQSPDRAIEIFDPEYAESVRRQSVLHANESVYCAKPHPEIAMLLASSSRPEYHIHAGERVFTVGHDVDEIDRYLRAAGVKKFNFRYGRPPVPAR